jgi:hypothetical protein
MLAVESMRRQFPNQTFTIQDWSGSGLVIYSEGIATADQLGDSRDESVKLSKEMKKAHRIEPVEDDQGDWCAAIEEEQEGFGTMPYGP